MGRYQSAPSGSGLIHEGNFWLWFGGIWLSVGAPFLLIGLVAGGLELGLDDWLARSGESTSGIVLAKSRTGRADEDGTSFHVEYRFTTAGGDTLRSDARVSREAWSSLREREAIEVRFLPEFPRWNRIAGREIEWVLPSVFTALGFLLTSLGSFVLLKARAMRAKRR